MSQTHETDTCEVLVVRNLNVAFRQQDAPEVQAVRQLSFSLRRGETLAIVGESGSGKSVTALALMRLLDAASSEVNSEGLWLRRRNRQVIALNEQTDAEMRRVRGADLAMIFQEPMTSLNPVFTIGEQIAESLRLHQGLGREEALRAAKKMLDQVRIPQAEEMLSRYPHQLSGGMRQRVMIAMALSCRPAVLIADEPTTALDVTIQAQILQLIAVLQKEMAMGVIFITHDMGVVADIADRVLVMYRGEAVETGSVEEIFRSPQHPYTQSLLAAVPRLGEMRGQDLPRRFPLPGQPLAESETPDTVVAGEPILQVRDLVARFPVRGGLLNRVTREVHAVEKVSFDLWPGETLSLVGESGCGKSTTGRALLRLVETQGGTITFDGQRIDTLAGGKLQALRRNIQFIFQDPYASLDPRQTVGDSIMEPLRVHGLLRGEAARERVAWLLKRVGLQPEHAWRYPHAFSGGQRQRICIALREKNSVWLLVAILISLVGVALLSWGDIGGPQSDRAIVGVGFAGATVLTYTIYIVGVKKSRISRLDPMIQAFYVLLFSACFFLVYALFTTGAPLPGKWHLWQNLLLLALVPTVVSNLTLVLAIKEIGSTMTSILGSMEPLTAVLVGVLHFGEKFGLDSASGLILIITAVIIVILQAKKKEHPQTLPHESIH